VCVKAGAENLSEISGDERRTLERLGLASNTRMACCAQVSGPVEVSLTPEQPKVSSPSRVAGFAFDRAVGRVVVVGNGIAGVTAADHVRRRHPLARLDVVAGEPHPLYNRMGIARLVYGRSAMRGLYLNPDNWYDEREITTWLNTTATAIDRDAQEIVLGTGQTLPYDRLILATGSESFVPPIGGVGTPGSFVLRTAADALALRAFAQRHHAHRAVVAGGGLLGLEAAYALRQLGLHTTVLERGAGLLRRQLDARAGELLRNYLEGLGLQIRLGAQVEWLEERDGRVAGVALATGEVLDADVFLVAAGIAPNVELARTARLDVGRGVRVDDLMRTSDARIFAVGDAAEHKRAVAGLWPVAVEQAEVAAENAVGGRRLYKPSPPLTMLKVVGVELTSIGRIQAEADDHEIVLDPGDGTYRKLVIADDRIVGAILLGHSSDAAAVRSAIERAQPVDGLVGELRAGRWSALAQLSGERPLLAATPA
jgi:nitrite reductase (NADH) large subunit